MRRASISNKSKPVNEREVKKTKVVKKKRVIGSEEQDRVSKMTEEEKMEYILSKSLDERDADDIEFVRKQTENIQIFQKLEKEAHEMVCAMLTLEVFNEEAVLMKEGELGDKFYIVLSGQVDVLKKMVQKKGEGHEMKNKRVALLGKGTSFGELALIHNAPRACTCKALARTATAVLDKTNYQALLMQGDKKLLVAKLDMLRKTTLFNGCSEKELTYISYFFMPKKYLKGDYIVSDATSTHEKLVVLADGRCQVEAKLKPTDFTIDATEQKEMDDKYSEIKHSPLLDQRFVSTFRNAKEQRSISLSTMGEGDYFGSEYMFSCETAYHEVVHSLSDTFVYEITKEEFFRRLRPSLINNIKATAELRSKWRTERITFLTKNPVAARINSNISNHGGVKAGIPEQLRKKPVLLSKAISHSHSYKDAASSSSTSLSTSASDEAGEQGKGEDQVGSFRNMGTLRNRANSLPTHIDPMSNPYSTPATSPISPHPGGETSHGLSPAAHDAFSPLPAFQSRSGSSPIISAKLSPIPTSPKRYTPLAMKSRSSSLEELHTGGRQMGVEASATYSLLFSKNSNPYTQTKLSIGKVAFSLV